MFMMYLQQLMDRYENLKNVGIVVFDYQLTNNYDSILIVDHFQKYFVAIKLTFSVTKGPPESPWHESLPPLSHPAHKNSFL